MNRRRTARACIVLLVALAALAGGGGLAAAVGPQKLDTGLTDPDDVLGDDAQRVRDALDALRAEDGIDLHVVLVPAFDGETGGEAWAETTADRSGLSSSDMLFAVAVDDGGYEWWVDGSFPRDEDDLSSYIVDSVEPKIDEAAWADAISTLVNGIGRSLPTAADDAAGDWSVTTTVLVVLAAAGALWAGHLLSRRPRAAVR
jgi:uncharacterized membrane protein YgcG